MWASILCEKSQKLNSHKQAYFLLQLHISAIFQSQDLQKPWRKHQFPQWKRIKSCSPKITHLLYKTSNIRFHEVLWTWCFTKNWHFSVRAWECCLSSDRASFDEQSLMQCCQPTILTIKHITIKMLCATIQANLLCNKLAWL